MTQKKNIHIIGGAGLVGTGIVLDLLSDRTIVPIERVVAFDVSQKALDRLAALRTWALPRSRLRRDHGTLH
ncbi:hypothetical protein ACSBOB_04155 [Mesorhizobium sp. ASY16-5R]|uniref:hypothetical protein n=1 Tax=Mesorhizobium sp. ASY16-5R TaxID=3445772 RepID=UPI003FA04003